MHDRARMVRQGFTQQASASERPEPAALCLGGAIPSKPRFRRPAGYACGQHAQRNGALKRNNGEAATPGVPIIVRVLRDREPSGRSPEAHSRGRPLCGRRKRPWIPGEAKGRNGNERSSAP